MTENASFRQGWESFPVSSSSWPAQSGLKNGFSGVYLGDRELTGVFQEGLTWSEGIMVKDIPVMTTCWDRLSPLGFARVGIVGLHRTCIQFWVFSGY